MEENLTPPQKEETITFKRSHFYSLLVLLAFAAGLLTGYMAWGRDNGGAQGASAQSGALAAAPATQAAQYKRYDVPTAGYPSFGPNDAPITIVEFSDFQCPYCRKFHQDTYQALLDAYPGQIRFVYRNLPLVSIHPEAFPAAVASRCALEQDAFWPYYEKIFSGEDMGQTIYVRYATELGLDVTAFQDCLASDRNNAFIQADSDFAVGMGVQSTPTFFINGLAVIGAQPLEVFKQVIDKELAGEIPK